MLWIKNKADEGIECQGKIIMKIPLKRKYFREEKDGASEYLGNKVTKAGWEGEGWSVKGIAKSQCGWNRMSKGDRRRWGQRGE